MSPRPTHSCAQTTGGSASKPSRRRISPPLDVAGGGTPLAGAAVYLWHCNIDGQYSMYDQGVVDENYLRGVQESDADGRVAFTSIFPAAYAGRWPYIHFEV